MGRLGAAILQGLGQTQWVAYSEAEYVETAVRLAQDQDALGAVRSGLRDRMARSCLMDEVGFTRDLEQAYHSMFALWAAKSSHAHAQAT